MKAISTLHNVTLGGAEQIFAKNDVDKTQSIFSTSISEGDVSQVVVSVVADQATETLDPAPGSVDQDTETLVLNPDLVVEENPLTISAVVEENPLTISPVVEENPLTISPVVEENPLTIDSASPPRETCLDTLTELPT